MKRLRAYLQSIGRDDAYAAFETYYDMLIEWNARFNLTAVTERAEVETKHFIDSLVGLPFMGESVLDIGAGAGFPSLVLAIVSPERQFTAVDSLRKRVGFLDAVVEALELKNVRTMHARAEDLPKIGFDTVTARAVAPLNVLAEYCLPFVRVGGRFVAYKAREAEEETVAAKRAIAVLGGGKVQIERVILPQTDIERAFVIVEKIKETPAKYPRGGNKPRSNPIL